jgi:hypothetical protein
MIVPLRSDVKGLCIPMSNSSETENGLLGILNTRNVSLCEVINIDYTTMAIIAW